MREGSAQQQRSQPPELQLLERPRSAGQRPSSAPDRCHGANWIPGMKTERRIAMSVQMVDGAALLNDRWAVNLEAGQGTDARLFAAAQSAHSLSFAKPFNPPNRNIL